MKSVIGSSAKKIADAVPSNWCDALLTGDEGMGKPPWGCPQVERLLNNVRERIMAVALNELSKMRVHSRRKPRRLLHGDRE